MLNKCTYLGWCGAGITIITIKNTHLLLVECRETPENVFFFVGVGVGVPIAKLPLKDPSSTDP